MVDIKTKKIPELRFREFSDEWSFSKLNDIADIKTGPFGSLLHEEDYVKNGTPMITVENLRYGFVTRLKNTPMVNDEDKARLKNYLLKEGDIVFSRVGSVDRSAYVTKASDGWLFSGRLLRVRPAIEAWYLDSYLHREPVKNFIRNLAVGGTMPSLNTALLGFAEIYYPSKKEQEKIAGFLTAVDDKISGLEKKKDLLQKYKKGVMQKIFLQKIRFREENGKDYPDWETFQLGEVGFFNSGVGFSNSEQGGESGIPFYKVSDLSKTGNEKEMKLSNNYVTKEQIKKNKYKIIKPYSIIFAKIGAALFLERKRIAHNFLIDNNLMAYTPMKDFNFMKHVFDTLRLSEFAQSGALPSLNAKDLSRIDLKLPYSVEEQQKIADFLTALDDKIELENKKLQQAKLFKKSLLQKMFV
jgi:type I restriction enzyme S subunit